MRIRASVVVIARTGVEMEALARRSWEPPFALWDMSKAIDDSLLIDSRATLSRNEQGCFLMTMLQEPPSA